jgi:hypothetical protein
MLEVEPSSVDSVGPWKARKSLRLLCALPVTFANFEAAFATYKLEEEIFQRS